MNLRVLDFTATPNQTEPLPPGPRSYYYPANERWSIWLVCAGGYSFTQGPFTVQARPGDIHLGLPQYDARLSRTADQTRRGISRVLGISFLIEGAPPPDEFWRLFPFAKKPEGPALPRPAAFVGFDDGIRQAFEAVQAEVQARQAGWEEVAAHLLQFALIRFGRHWERALSGDASTTNIRRAQATEQIRRIDAFLQENLHRRISPEDLCRVVHLSPQRLRAVYRSQTGQTPLAALEELRAKRAKELLRNPALPIKEVALAVGYADPAHFSRAFARIEGRSPLEFRRACQMASVLSAGGASAS